MAEAPTLETPRLSLVAFSEEHLTERYVGWLNDPDVVRFSEQRHLTHSIESCRVFTSSFADGPHHLWAIIEKEKGLGHIGNINTAVDAPNRCADIAIMIGEKQAWGQGLGAEAWMAVVEYLLGPGTMRKVTAGTMAENEGMLRIMNKAGMVEEGRRKGQFILEGREVDSILVARFAENHG